VLAVIEALQTVVFVVGGTVACGIAACNRALVTTWIGPDSYGGTALTAAMGLALCASLLSGVLVQAVFVFGHERFLTLVGIAQAVITLAASVALVHLVGPLGVPLAALLAIGGATIPLFVTTLAKDLGLRRRDVVATSGRFALRFVPVFVVAVALGRIDYARPLVMLAVNALVVGGLCLAVFGVHLFRPPLAPYVVPRLRAWLPRWGEAP
jgi:hypothetical protein